MEASNFIVCIGTSKTQPEAKKKAR